MELFTRSILNPILKPLVDHDWESRKLYNPGVIFHNGKYHLFYRAVGKDWISTIGYAVSSDGENFERSELPLLKPDNEFAIGGLEDPRISKIQDTFYMAYANFDGVTPRLCTAVSDDLKTWKNNGPAFKDWNFASAGGKFAKWDEQGQVATQEKKVEWSKSGGIFPEKINGKFSMMFGEFRIWFAHSDNGIDWKGDRTPFLEPREGNFFDNTFVEMGPPPIKTKDAWLVLYHGIDTRHCYRLGYLLLDLEDPRKILYRSDKPIFEPFTHYELSGIVDVIPGASKMREMNYEELDLFIKESQRKGIMPKVIFCCGAVLEDDILRIYYGAGDTLICTATAKLNDIINS